MKHKLKMLATILPSTKSKYIRNTWSQKVTTVNHLNCRRQDVIADRYLLPRSCMIPSSVPLRSVITAVVSPVTELLVWMVGITNVWWPPLVIALVLSRFIWDLPNVPSKTVVAFIHMSKNKPMCCFIFEGKTFQALVHTKMNVHLCQRFWNYWNKY